MHLFDGGPRTFRGYSDHAEPTFKFLNRSAWPSVEKARDTLELWFARIPDAKKTDVRRRFRGSNAEHKGAFLEIATDAVLRAIGCSVNAAPDLDGQTPDFLATHPSATIVVECTVVQESDEKRNTSERINVIKDAIDSIQSGRFYLEMELLELPSASPSTRRLKQKLEEWLASLDPDKEMIRFNQGLELRSFVWDKDGWKALFGAIPASSRKLEREEARAIGMETGEAVWTQDGVKFGKALEKKAERYKSIVDSPYLIVASLDTLSASSDDMLDALFGGEVYTFNSSSPESEHPTQFSRSFDGLLGSPSTPRNRHVSAILYKPQLDLWNLCDSDPPWQIVHNPWAKRPLAVGLFPSARERFPDCGKLSEREPTCTLNKVLGLSDPWPGRER